MSQDPSSWVERMVGWCVSILFAVIALYCAVRLIQSIQGTLIVIIGILALIAAVVSVVVVISTWRNRW